MSMSFRIGQIFACQPAYGLTHPDSARMFWIGDLKSGDSRLRGKVYKDQFRISFGSGNIFFATALNAQEFDGWDITHIFTMHNDVVPEVGYLDILMDEIERTGADFLSVLLPIKDLNGLSSTAIDSVDNPFCVERRITMTEAYQLPETFDAADCGYPDRALLVNTGLFLMDWTKDWRKLTNPDGTLQINCTSPDRIKRRPPNPGKVVDARVTISGRQAVVASISPSKVVKVVFQDDNSESLLPLEELDLPKPHNEALLGRWEAQHSPADWLLSRHLHSVGAKVMCTRKVKALHMGDMPWTNMNPWGQWAVDEALKHQFGDRKIGRQDNGGPSQAEQIPGATVDDTARNAGRVSVASA